MKPFVNGHLETRIESIGDPTSYTLLNDCIGTPCEKIRNGKLLFIHIGIDQNNFHFGSQTFFGPRSSPVSCWVKSHGAPFMSRIPNQDGYEGLRKDIVMDAQIGGKTNGMLQFQSFEKDKLYFLKFKYQVVKTVNNQTTGLQPSTYEQFGSLDHFYVKFVNVTDGANGFELVNGPSWSWDFVKPTPTPSSYQNIGELTNVPETFVELPNPTGALPMMQEITFCIKANANYNAIWFCPQQNAATAHNSRIRIKDVEMQEAWTSGPTVNVPCSGGAVQLGGGCATIPGATYSWSPAFGLSNPSVLQPTLNGSGIASGQEYTLTVSRNGCSVSDTVTITNNKPVLNLPPQVLTCKDNLPIYLNANPSNPSAVISYQWYMLNQQGTQFEAIPGANAATLLVGAFGWYVVVADGGNGCTAVAYTQVAIMALPANLNTDFSLVAWGPSGQNSFYMYASPEINPSAQGLFHAYYISQVDANYNFIQPIGVAWGTNAGQWIAIYDPIQQSNVIYQFARGAYYEVKHGIWNECGDWTETKRYVFID